MTTDGYLSRVCPLCGSHPPEKAEIVSPIAVEDMIYEDLVPYWNGFHKQRLFFSYFRCNECKLLFAKKFFNPSQLERMYAQMPPNMDVVPSDVLRATQRGYYELFKSKTTFEKDYLEIGPDIGLFTENCARDNAFAKYWLFEPNREVTSALTAAMEGADVEIIHDMFNLVAVPDQSIGAAVLIQVLDHLIEPLDALRAIRSKLTAGGRILIVTHNEASLLRRLLGVRWPPFCLQHPQVYSPASMRALLERAGFADVAIQPSTNHFPLSFLAKNGLWACGLKVDSIPNFGGVTVGLKLGNMITLARAA